MKLTQLLKAYAPARSASAVQVSIYNEETKKSEVRGLTNYEVVHFDEMDWPLKNAKVESFDIRTSIAGERPILRIYVSINQ